ncbi:GntR family transcriptional regulator [Ramlibacter sp.]|uniref:GntR family transcriptional regulator n=1 Tax=Ramlibacter sp. TaxID=1917967 RepID=UPI003D13168E
MTESSAQADAADAATGDVARRTQRMYEQIVAGLTEHRIAPGTRLREERLAALFEVSRTQVRKVLQRLIHEGLVEHQPNRGVTVVAPDLDETREIFEARRLIEPWVVSRLCANCTKKGALGLRRILREEQKAYTDDDRRSAVRLSGEFHRALAQAAGNRAIAKSMDELTLRTCLAILANQAPTASTCRTGEHENILAAVERGDARTATRLMLAHLESIEASLEAEPAAAKGDGLESLVRELAAAPPRKRRAAA